METRASYVAVGTFVLLLAAAFIVFVVWLGRVGGWRGCRLRRRCIRRIALAIQSSLFTFLARTIGSGGCRAQCGRLRLDLFERNHRIADRPAQNLAFGTASIRPVARGIGLASAEQRRQRHDREPEPHLPHSSSPRKLARKPGALAISASSHCRAEMSSPSRPMLVTPYSSLPQEIGRAPV